MIIRFYDIPSEFVLLFSNSHGVFYLQTQIYLAMEDLHLKTRVQLPSPCCFLIFRHIQS